MQIPTFIGTLPNITTLDLSDNTFTGPIPSSIQNMSKLEVLRLHNNMLDGEIPTWLFKITTLEQLFIGGKGNGLIWNNEAKIVPDCSLAFLSMPSCNISGQIPEWISSQKDMAILDLSNNKLVGRFPYALADQGNLEIIILSENNLEGLIPPLLFESKYLLVLDLSRNNFDGELPTNIGNAKRIDGLFLSGNNLSGQIPMSISRLNSLRTLDFPDMGKCCKKGQSKSFNASTQTSGDLIAVGAHVGGGTIKVWNLKICPRLILMWEDRFCRGKVEEMDGCDD
ncbi:hypothetical protein L1987_82009 [Smallanthus sonchifolius]|uniref:Uncharacterized protein n=1 Tax=Smallanthus sonchifolius TaxID=185202 RepID=A0ACB8YSM8_9ASTR|nr:hypothetical protein L1987_82009 [Smallanthus sonchifolius]